MEEKKKQTEPEACKVAKKCGGCQYQGVPYKEQLKKKQKMVNALLSKYGKVEPIIGMENPYYYRNKVHAVFDRDRKGNIVSGTYEAKTHRVVPVENCLIEDKKSQEIIRTIRGLLKSFKIKTYDEDTGYGLLRHVLVRRGFETGEIMVVLVLGSPILPSKNNFVKALRKEHPEITTVVLNINDRKTSMILGEREKVLYGKGFIRDELCGCTFRISPKSFYQVNPVQTEILYQKAIEFAHLTGKESVIDAYCGIGTIGLIKAVDTFQAERGIRLTTYASKCIQNELLMHFRRKRRTAGEVSLSDTLETDGDGNALSLQDTISCEDEGLNAVDDHDRYYSMYRALFSSLSPREREVIRLRYGLGGTVPLTQREIASTFGISRSYVSRIEKRALEKLRAELEKPVGSGAGQ